MSIIKLKTLKYFASNHLVKSQWSSPRDTTFAQISYKYNDFRKVEKISKTLFHIGIPIHFGTIFCLWNTSQRIFTHFWGYEFLKGYNYQFMILRWRIIITGLNVIFNSFIVQCFLLISSLSVDSSLFLLLKLTFSTY